MVQIKEINIKGLYTLYCKGNDTFFIIRTPYNSKGYKKWIEEVNKRYGYTIIVQDVRGRYGSAGSWKPYSYENEDAKVLAEFILQHHANEVVIFGSSYEAYCARLLACILEDIIEVKLVLRVGVRSQYEALFNKKTFRLADYYWWNSIHGKGKKSALSLKISYANLQVPNLKFPKKNHIVYPNVPVILIGGWDDGYYQYAFEDYINWENPNAHLYIGKFGHELHMVNNLFNEVAWYKNLEIVGKSEKIEYQNQNVYCDRYYDGNQYFTNVESPYREVVYDNSYLSKNNYFYIQKRNVFDITIDGLAIIKTIKLEHNLLEKPIFGQLVCIDKNVKIHITEFILEQGSTKTILPPLLIKNNNIRLEFLLSTSMFPRYAGKLKDVQIVEITNVIAGGTRYED
ncbi:CocE/NonD family hydrolase [Streptococcus anginosus]|uniref:CocE/NonD family hydrolase n=1 Tax=Streptococcus anginosus TaxID=1328 RepID=UPI00321B7B53